MTPVDDVELFAKLGERKYMKRLLKYGELYFRPLHEFAEMDEMDGIGDKLETAINYTSPLNPEITLRSQDGWEFKLSKGARISYHMHDRSKGGHIYSMLILDCEYITNDHLRIKNQNELSQIGHNYGSMVIICDCETFISRITQKIDELGYELYYAPVSYYPEEDVINKTVSPFEKREKYSYQKEFRFIVDCGLKDSFVLQIGNIEDIATLTHKKLKIQRKP